MIASVAPVPVGRPSFLDAPRCQDLASLEADLAIIAIPYNTPCDLTQSRSPCSLAPGAIREQSLRLTRSLEGHYDFEFGGDLFAGLRMKIVDCGDVAMLPGRYEENNRMATAVIEAILERGALPITLGGDHSSTIPVVRAYQGWGPLCLMQIGADLNWRHEVKGVHDGASSTMRRAAELPWVTSMVQVGLRGTGSARQREVDDAEAFGSVLVRAEELHRVGVEQVLRRVPAAGSYYVTLNANGLDPAIAPGVSDIAFGGLTYFEATNLLRGVATKGRVLGMDWVGAVPSVDVMGLTSLLGARLILNLAGALAHTEQIGSGESKAAATRQHDERAAVLA